MSTRWVPRRLVGVAALVAVASCRESPTTPSRVVRPSFTLGAGAYMLTIAVAPLSSSVPSSPCLEIASAADRVVLPVSVEQVEKGWQVRPLGDADLGFTAALESSGPNALAGSAEGQARDPQSGVVVTVSALPTAPGFSSLGPSRLLGSLEGSNAVSGLVMAHVRFAVGLLSRVCSVNNWRLEPR